VRPPELGAAVRDQFLLDQDFLTVNHGSFGAVPRTVLAAQDAWRLRLERQPTRFMETELPAALRAAAARLAAFVGAEEADLAFVDNATTGCNAVLHSLPLAPGDAIVVLDHGYGAVRNAARHAAQRAGARLVEAAVPFPRPRADAIIAGVAAALDRRTKLVVLDHVTSHSALALPLASLVAACHEAGAKVLVDGAHGPGMVTVDLGALNADWYAGNCHKWLGAPKGSAFLWARRDRQQGLHPVTVSHGYGSGFLAEFDWTGTRDPSAFLAVTAAIDVHEALGGPALRRRNAELAGAAARLIADRLGTETGADPAQDAAMAVVRLPIAGRATPEGARALRRRLIAEFRCDAPVNALGGGYWLRLSAAAYNAPADYDRLADTAARLARAAA
jgi:isopenicillin-N epimerase